MDFDVLINLHYTIPRTTGELQHYAVVVPCGQYYTIPRTTGELQLHAL